jgi:hypothetical protein
MSTFWSKFRQNFRSSGWRHCTFHEAFLFNRNQFQSVSEQCKPACNRKSLNIFFVKIKFGERYLPRRVSLTRTWRRHSRSDLDNARWRPKKSNQKYESQFVDELWPQGLIFATKMDKIDGKKLQWKNYPTNFNQSLGFWSTKRALKPNVYNLLIGHFKVL